MTTTDLDDKLTTLTAPVPESARGEARRMVSATMPRRLQKGHAPRLTTNEAPESATSGFRTRFSTYMRQKFVGDSVSSRHSAGKGKPRDRSSPGWL